MARAKKKNIAIKIIVDTREQDVSYIKDCLDSRIGKDGIKIESYEIATVKPLDVNTGEPCKTSTGDITIMYREKDTDNEWKLSNLAVELKKNLDILSSLLNASNRERLQAECLRAKEYGLDFYFITTNSLDDTIKQIAKVPKLRATNCEVTHFEQLCDYNKLLADSGHNPIIVSGKSLAWSIRRVIKRHVKENKLQYKC